MIRKNTPIPVTRSEAFETVYDGQKAIEVKVYQGEDPDALNNTVIGSYTIEGLSNAPTGNVIVTTFALDIDGILHVSSVEKRTGLEKRITIENATARFERHDMDAARERVRQLIDGEVAQAGTALREAVQAQALIEKAERLLDRVGAEDAEDLVNAIELVRDALVAEDAQALEQAVADLTDLIFYLET